MLRGSLTAITSLVTLKTMLNSSELIAALRGENPGVCSALDVYVETQQIYAASLAAMGMQNSPTSHVASVAEVTIAVPLGSMSVISRRHEHPTIHPAE